MGLLQGVEDVDVDVLPETGVRAAMVNRTGWFRPSSGNDCALIEKRF